MTYSQDETHCHCIDCGKLYEPDKWIGSCDICGGFIDFCDGRCKNLNIMQQFEALGICWEKFNSLPDWNLENFAKFWADIEYEEAMRQKAWLYYAETDYDDYEPEDWDDEPEYDPDWDIGDY